MIYRWLWPVSRERARVRFALVPLLGALLLGASGCATSSRYMGISMLPGESSPEVQALAQRARVGDKQAQLDLGIRFEEGNGVPRDKARAIKLYKQAASDSGGTTWVYSPSPGNGAPARVIPVDTGPRQAGLEEAKSHLSEKGEPIPTQSPGEEELEQKMLQVFSPLEQSPYEFERLVAEMVLDPSQFRKKNPSLPYICKPGPNVMQPLHEEIDRWCSVYNKGAYWKLYIAQSDLKNGYYRNCKLRQDSIYEIDGEIRKKFNKHYRDYLDRSYEKYGPLFRPDHMVGGIILEIVLNNNLYRFSFANPTRCLLSVQMFDREQ